MDINQVQQRIVDDFNQFDDWMDKYALLIELGNGLQAIDEKYKAPQNIIEGCQSRVWLMAEMENGIVYYKAESDAILVKGIVALLLEVFSGRTPDEILNADLFFIEKIGLREHLSPTRSNGLLAMIRQIRLYALALKSKSAQS
jgi:cysteine desulfuration protein SufE